MTTSQLRLRTSLRPAPHPQQPPLMHRLAIRLLMLQLRTLLQPTRPLLIRLLPIRLLVILLLLIHLLLIRPLRTLPRIPRRLLRARMTSSDA